MHSTVVNALVKRRAELAGDIEKTHETLSLDALRSSLSQWSILLRDLPLPQLR
jgi:hypothetical protein